MHGAADYGCRSARTAVRLRLSRRQQRELFGEQLANALSLRMLRAKLRFENRERLRE
jgi:hypothetical protein